MVQAKKPRIFEGDRDKSARKETSTQAEPQVKRPAIEQEENMKNNEDDAKVVFIYFEYLWLRLCISQLQSYALILPLPIYYPIFSVNL
jgi:hypothetical protein